MKNSFLLIIYLFINHSILAQSQVLFEPLQSKIDSILIAKNIPGAQLAIVSKDSVIWKHNFGYSDLENKTPVNDHTMFRIGSVTKSFIALAALTLVEEGKLKLSDKVKQLAPEIPYRNKWSKTHPVQIVHLLEHTAGFDDMHLVEYATQGPDWTTLQGLQFHPDSRTSRWKPGMHMSYCNGGPPMTAFIIEKITGETIEDYVQEKIMQPIGMKHTSFLLTDYVQQHLAKGYFGEDNQEAKYWHIIDRSAGSINSTVTEMANYIQLYLNRGKTDSTRLLQATTIDRMEIAKSTLAGKTGEDEGYGLHIFSWDFKGVRMHGHTGGMNGYLTDFTYIPEKNIGFILLINKNGAGFRDLRIAIRNYLVDRNNTWQEPEAKAVGFDKNILGYYRSATTRNQIARFMDWPTNVVQIKERGGKVFIKNLFGKERALHIESEKVFRNYSDNGDSSPLLLLKDDDGQTILQKPLGGNNYYKTSGFAAWGIILLGGLAMFFMISSILVSLVWLVMWMFGKSIRFKRARVFPFLAVLSFSAFLMFFAIAQIRGDVIENLGTASIWSMGIFVTSVLFGIFSLISLIIGFQSFNHSMHRAARIYFFLASLSCVLVAGYLMYWGIIGVRTWVY